MRFPRPTLRMPRIRIPLPGVSDTIEAAALAMIAVGTGWKVDPPTGLIVGGVLLLAWAVAFELVRRPRK